MCLLSDLSIFTDILFRQVLGHGTEADHVLVIDGGRHHVQLAGPVDGAEQFLVQFIGAVQSEADESHLHLVANLETLVLHHELLKVLGQTDVVADVLLQTRNSIVAQHKPGTRDRGWENIFCDLLVFELQMSFASKLPELE